VRTLIGVEHQADRRSDSGDESDRNDWDDHGSTFPCFPGGVDRTSPPLFVRSVTFASASTAPEGRKLECRRSEASRRQLFSSMIWSEVVCPALKYLLSRTAANRREAPVGLSAP
jgi:hypothetical protein